MQLRISNKVSLMYSAPFKNVYLWPPSFLFSLSPFTLFSVVENFLVLEQAQNRIACPVGMNLDIKYDIKIQIVLQKTTFALDFFP